MGTQNAWEGSGGRDWSRVRDDSEDLLSDPSQDTAEALLPSLGDALDWLDRPDGDLDAVLGDSQNHPQLPSYVPLPAGPSWSGHPRTRGSGGGRGGSGRGGGRAGGAGKDGGGSSSQSSRRSRARAASVGGQVLSAGLAYQRGDADTLRGLGLDLAELRSLSSLRRANAILNAAVGADGGIEETELRKVNARVLNRVLGEQLEGVAAVRLYIVEYVMQVWASETGDARRNGDHAVGASRESERQLRGALSARARQLTIAASATAAELREAISGAMALMRRLMRGT